MGVRRTPSRQRARRVAHADPCARWPTATRPVLAHDLTSLRVLASTGEPWNEAPWRWYFDVVGGGRCPIINISGGTEVGACFLSPHVVAPMSACSLGGPALGMAVDVFDDDGQPVRGEVGELVCTRAVAGNDARAVPRSGALSRDVLVAVARRVVARRLRERRPPTANGSCTVAPTTPSRSRASGSVPPRSRRWWSPTLGVLEAAAVGVPDEVKGEVLWVFVGRRARRATRRRPAFGPRSSRPRRRRARSVVQAGRGAFHECAAEDAERQGAAARDSCRRHRRRRRRPVGSRGSGDARRDQGRSVTASRCHDRAHRFAGDAPTLAPRRLGGVARGAAAVPRLARAMGARTRTRAAWIRRSTSRRSGRVAGPGIVSATSTPRTASGCSCSTGGSRARSASGACSAARSRWATSGTGSTRRSAAAGTCPRASS